MSTRVQISLYALTVIVEADLTYPDQIHDLVNRASFLYTTALEVSKASGVNIADEAIIDEED